MSGLLNSLHDLHQQHKERREARHGRGYHDEDDSHDSEHHRNQRPYQAREDDDADRLSQDQSYGQGRGYAPPSGPPPRGYGSSGFAAQGGLDRGDYATDAEIDCIGSRLQSQRLHEDDDNDTRRRFQGHSQGYAPPPGPPPASRGPTGFASQGGLDRGDFASDADIDRMVSAGEFDGRQKHGRDDYGYGGADMERRNAYDRDDAPTGPPRQGYGGSTNEYGRYDAPSGPPPGRSYQSQQHSQQGFESGYGAEHDRLNQYGPPQTQSRTQYEAPQGPLPDHGRSQGNAPAGGFGSSRYGGERDDPRYSGPNNQRSEAPHRGEAASYYDQQSTPGRYGHLARMAQEHGNDDPEVYQRAAQGLDERMQAQAKSRIKDRDDEEEDYKAHVDAHRKAYGDADNGPMDTKSIGLAAAMEAIKQTAAAGKSSNAPSGAFKAGKSNEGPSSKPGRIAQEEEAATEGGDGSRGMQDKLVALAMAHAGKLFDKKNAGSKEDKSEDKSQAMQSAAATAMQLFAKYKTKGTLDSSDMSTVMGLAMKLI